LSAPRAAISTVSTPLFRPTNEAIVGKTYGGKPERCRNPKTEAGKRGRRKFVNKLPPATKSVVIQPRSIAVIPRKKSRKRQNSKKK